MRLTFVWYVPIANISWHRFAEDVQRFVWRQQIPHRLGESGDADYVVRPHIVSLAGSTVHEQGREPMGEIALVEVGAQGSAVERDINVSAV